jgi:hypothetical protein
MTNETLKERVQNILAERTDIPFEDQETKPEPEQYEAHRNRLAGVASSGDFAAAAVDVFAEKSGRRDYGNSHKDIYLLIHLPTKEVELLHEDTAICCGRNCPFESMKLRTEGSRVILEVKRDAYWFSGDDQTMTFEREYRPGFVSIKPRPGLGELCYHK